MLLHRADRHKEIPMSGDGGPYLVNTFVQSNKVHRTRHRAILRYLSVTFPHLLPVNTLVDIMAVHLPHHPTITPR